MAKINNELIVSGGADDVMIKIWNCIDGACLKIIQNSSTIFCIIVLNKSQLAKSHFLALKDFFL